MKYLLIIGLWLCAVWASAQPYLPSQQPDFYYNQAILHFQSGDYTAASRLMSEYLQYEQSLEAIYYRAMSAIKARQSAGKHYVKSFLDDYPLHPLAHKAQFELAHGYFVEQSYSEAALAYGEMDPATLDAKQREQAEFEKGYSFLQMGVQAQGKASLLNAYALNGSFRPASAYYLGTVTQSDSAIMYFEEAAKYDEWKLRATLFLAQWYLKEQSYDKVITSAEPLLTQEKSTDNYDLHLYVAEAYYGQQKYRPAVRNYAAAIGLGVKVPDAETRFKLGHAYYEIGDKANAIEQLKMAGLNDSPTGQASAFQLGKIYTETGQYANALHAFDIAAEGDSDLEIKEQAAFLAAKVSVRLEQFGEAIVKLENFISNFPQSSSVAEANDLLSQAYLNTSNYDLAIAHFEKSQSTSNVLRANYQKVTLIKGMQLFSDRQVAAAVGFLQKSTATPVNKALEVDAWYWLGECHFALGNTEKAKEAYGKARGLDVRHAQSDYGLGYLYYNEQNYTEAKSYFQTFLRKDQNSSFRSDARMRIADCDYALKNYADALEGYGRLVGAGVAQDYILFQMGLIHQLNGRTDAAVAEFGKVTAMSASTYRDNALFQSAQAYLEDARFEQAAGLFGRYIQQYPDDPMMPMARIRRAQCYFNQGNMAGAKADYLFVLDNHIAHPAANNALLGLQELQKQDESIHFDKYLAAYRQANPDDSSLESIEFEQAKTLYFAQKYTQAVQAFEALLSKNAGSGFREDALYYLGDSYDRLGNFAQANRFYEQIIEIQGSTYLSRVLDKRGRLLLGMGEGEKAVANYERLKSVAKNRKEAYLADEGLMKAYFLQGANDRVLTQANTILSAEWKPSNAVSQAYLYKGKAYKQMGAQDNAVDEFLNVINAGSDELAAEAKYRIAEMQHGQAKYNQSLETLFQLNASYGAYQQWIGQSFLLIADNYLKMNELLQAKATLQSLVDNFPDEAVKRQARTQLAKIDGIQQQQTPNDTIR